MMNRLFTLMAALALTASPAQSQTQRPDPPGASGRLGHGPDSIPDISSRLIAVFGARPLSDSTLVNLARRGLRVTDRSPAAIEKARREKRRLDAAQVAVLIETRYDSLARAPILVASLLDVASLRRLRLTSVLLPARGRPWGAALDTVLTRLLARP
jgi:hypothetical protein